MQRVGLEVEDQSGERVGLLSWGGWDVTGTFIRYLATLAGEGLVAGRERSLGVVTVPGLDLGVVVCTIQPALGVMREKERKLKVTLG